MCYTLIMNYIKGKFKNAIFETETGYKVGLFKVEETDHEEIVTNKLVTFTGYFGELNYEDTYLFTGEYIYHERYGYQFSVKNYERVVPEGKEAIIDFLTSSFVKGCGEKTAQKIYQTFGNDALIKIKENKNNLLLVPDMTEKKQTQIYNSIIKYYDADEEILYLKSLGFTIRETMLLISLYRKDIKGIIDDNIYLLRDFIEFKKLDQIFLQTGETEDERRIYACIIETMKNLTFSQGDTYLVKQEILEGLANTYHIYTGIDNYLKVLSDNGEIMIINDDYYLMEDYLNETVNANAIAKLLTRKSKTISNFNKVIKPVEKTLKITYNDEQKGAIKMALEHPLSIITGGPGTGKTTIIKGIIKLYSEIHKLSEIGANKHILLLAPTGRASKRMSEVTQLGASTIHRFLKWDKDRNSFGINEFNKIHYDLVIVDETSMLDNFLLAALFKGLDLGTQIIFVGDEYQLPSVGPGLILNDMINSEVIPHTRLTNIYRQSENSFIPLLAREIKEAEVMSNLMLKRDDYNFIAATSDEIKSVITQILKKCQTKGLDDKEIQVLAPMYKGENGIDNLNVLLQNLLNPANKDKKEVVVGTIIYREGDKILNLVNDVDLNIYNGDIGYIIEVNKESKTDFLIINYEGNTVSYKKDMLNTITHAYAISIHKAQGSEFNHVIIPMSLGYRRMLYNKLLYTGVSRAKKSLVLIGSINAFNAAVTNNYSVIRKTALKSKILYNFDGLG